MKYALLTLCSALLSWTSIAQNPTNSDTSKPYIEVVGQAEMEVVPDEIYIKFHLKEFEKDRVMQTIEMQEKELTAALTAAGLPISEINVSDFESNFVRVTWGKKDFRTEKEYHFKVKTMQETAKVFEVFDKLDITDGHIERVDHSQRKTFEDNMRIEATKNAKKIANDMLSSIGQSVGKALYISDKKNIPNVDSRQIGYLNDDARLYEYSGLKGGTVVQYQKIKIISVVSARFEII
ncbi:MAG: hypothetical protein RLZZ262_238 [Bacteroidota bacterium]